MQIYKSNKRKYSDLLKDEIYKNKLKAQYNEIVIILREYEYIINEIMYSNMIGSYKCMMIYYYLLNEYKHSLEFMILYLFYILKIKYMNSIMDFNNTKIKTELKTEPKIEKKNKRTNKAEIDRQGQQIDELTVKVENLEVLVQSLLLKFENQKPKLKISKGEQLLGEKLKECFPFDNFVKIRPDWLKNPNTNRNLELDFYCETLKLAFEFQGEQHRIYSGHFHGHPENYNKQLERDNIKRKLCKKKGVLLVEIFEEDLNDQIWIKKIEKVKTDLVQLELDKAKQPLYKRIFTFFIGKK